MLEKDSIVEVQEFLMADAFYKEAHKVIFSAISSLNAALNPIDIYTVNEYLKQHKQLEAVGGTQYLIGLTQKVGSAAHIVFHAKIIAQKYVQRELIRASTEIQRRSYDEENDVTDLIDFAEGEIFKVSEGHVAPLDSKLEGHHQENPALNRGGLKKRQQVQRRTLWFHLHRQGYAGLAGIRP